MPLSSRALTLAALCSAMLGPLARADVTAEVDALISHGRLDDALSRAQQAEKAEPKSIKARFLTGVVLMEMRRETEALSVFRQLAQEYPELPDPFNNIGVIQARDGQLEEAQQALRTALRNDPLYRAAQVNLGQVELMLAVKAWEAAASTGPYDADLQHKLEAARALLGAPMLTTPGSAR